MLRTVPNWSRIFFASALVAIPAVSAAGSPRPEFKPWVCDPICHPQIFDARVEGPISLQVVASPGAPAAPIEVKALAWSSAELEPLKSADPQEGGQVVRPVDPATALAHRKAGHGQDEAGKAAPVIYSADPQEGGQVYSADPEEGGEVVRGADAASARAMGQRMHKPLATLAEPVARKGKVKVSVLMGACVKGQHFDKATITMRRGTYTLQDVDVAGCTTNGDNTDTCTLTYASLGE